MRPKGSGLSITPEMQSRFFELVADGIDLRTSARMAGTNYSTVRDWRLRGEAGDPRYVAFAVELKKARAAAIAARIQRIANAAKPSVEITERLEYNSAGEVVARIVTTQQVQGQWQADAWYLERVHSDRFGSQRREIAELKKLVAQLLQERGHVPLATAAAALN